MSYIINMDSVAKAIEYMMLDSLLSANRHMRFAEYMKDPRKYLYLNDSLINRIEASEEPVRHCPNSSNDLIILDRSLKKRG